ncbi:TonB-dependent receptor [Pseudoxanthomonas kalamensis DSM 18571]|uniref:TonB-dependent receptor plug domain-containing protein n=1 Tax=Pseudoxanthomonas kalamensis TaxID=289483 RepID=UPI001391615D|nr:TonB-dependent receptor [Pseudoxanthomonas kalamensis]KAF1711127.1 TonB-dependent receptor [Pseudoxanthomonas kalamensis DSM 18571]
MKNKLSLLSIAVLGALASQSALAQDNSAPANTLDTLIVTGTRVADRTVAESTAPIDIISPEVLEGTGTTELATALSRALPSLNFPRPAVSDGTDAVRPAQLRGLSPDHVLVLVNGKRYHSGALVNVNGTQGRGSAPADLNTIPIAAIARVEVLRDGASAQYGSDAIAGVINIVLKGSESGGSIAARYGQYSAGDGQQYQLSADAGLKLGEAGKIHFAAQGGHQDQTDRARPYLGSNPGPNSSNPPAGEVSQRLGDPEVDHGSFAYNGELNLTDYLTLYSYGIYTKRDVLSNGYFREDLDPNNIQEIYPNGFLPQINNVSTDYDFVLGAKTWTDGGTNIDLSYTYGSNELTFDIKNTLNRSLGPTSPTRFFAGALEYKQHVLNLDFNKALEWGLAYPVTLSYGVEWRGEEFIQTPGEPDSYANGSFGGAAGSQVFPGFQPGYSGNYDRNSLSFYAGLEGNITEKFALGLAARAEDYSDFGNTTTGKITARYDFSPAVALRGTVSTGFHAPALQQQNFQAVSTNFIDGIPYDIATFRVDHPAAVALGAEPLKPEESVNYSLGLVLQPADGLYVTIDAYRIAVDDRITLSANLTSTAVRNYLNANGFPSVGGGRYFTNAIDTTTDGIDIVGTYNWKLANSSIDLTAGYNYNKTTIDRVAGNPAALEAIDPTAERFSRVEIGRFEKGAPRDKLSLGGTWHLASFDVSASATRYGEFTSFSSNPDNDQTFGAEWTLDLAATYRINGWEFTLGGDNVLNEYPDELIYATSNNGQFPYSGSSPFGFNGAFMYANIGYKW